MEWNYLASSRSGSSDLAKVFAKQGFSQALLAPANPQERSDCIASTRRRVSLDPVRVEPEGRHNLSLDPEGYPTPPRTSQYFNASHTSYLKTNKELHLDKSSYKVDSLILREDFNSKTLKSFDN